MRIQYQNTFEEYVEALAALAARRAKKRRARVLVYSAGVVVLFLAAIWFYESIAHLDEYVVLFHLLVPFAVLVAVVLAVLCSTSMIAGRLPRIPLRTALRLGIFIGAIVVILFLYEDSRRTNPQSPRFMWTWTLLLPHTTWLFLAVWTAIATIKNRRDNVRRMWDEQPTFHRAKTTDISAEGVVICDAVSRAEMHWNAFIGWQETKSLFVLFPSELAALFLPKRAFASAEELEAIRALARFIPTTATAAFPVVQSDTDPSNPRPLPAQQNVSAK